MHRDINSITKDLIELRTKAAQIQADMHSPGLSDKDRKSKRSDYAALGAEIAKVKAEKTTLRMESTSATPTKASAEQKSHRIAHLLFPATATSPAVVRYFVTSEYTIGQLSQALSAVFGESKPAVTYFNFIREEDLEDAPSDWFNLLESSDSENEETDIPE